MKNMLRDNQMVFLRMKNERATKDDIEKHAVEFYLEMCSQYGYLQYIINNPDFTDSQKIVMVQNVLIDTKG